MSNYNPFNSTIRPIDDNIHHDQPHGGWSEHLDVTRRLPGISEFRGSEQIRIDHSGNIIGGTTNIGKIKMPW